MEKEEKKATQTELDAEKVAAQDVLPRLLAQREKLEREGGAFSRVERNHWIRMAIGGAASAILVVYALMQTWSADAKAGTPVFPWVIAGVAATVTIAMAKRWDKTKGDRKRAEDELSEKMRQIGRRIENADRTMRR